jgi:predicted transcriptional regulator
MRRFATHPAAIRRSAARIARNIWGTRLLNYDQKRASAFLDLAGEVVSAYVANNPVPASELPGLIATLHSALQGLATGAPQATREQPEVRKATPSQIRQSITPDALISFVDGKPYKTLKRHLTSHGLHPGSYRQRYGLPKDYPMVAVNYGARRSALAKAIGLGQSPRTVEFPQASVGGRRKAR